MTPPWLLVAGDFRPDGGMDQANYHLAWHLAETVGANVSLVAHHVAAPLVTHPRVRWHPVSRPLGMHVLGAPLLDWTGRQEAGRLRAADPQARVVVNGGNCPWPGVNWVHMVHHACGRADSGAPWLFRLKNGINRARARRRERRALAVGTLVIANSEKTRRELIDLVGVPADRVRVVYLASDPSKYRPACAEERNAARQAFGLPAGVPVALFIGALGYDRNKGLDTLLRAWQGLGREEVLIAAGGGRLAYWQKQIDGLGLSSRVRLVGHTARIAEWMAAADVLVSPTRYDAYGLAVHEALCCGLPALVSRAAGVAERYPAELADLILDDPEDWAELAVRLGKCLAEPAASRSRVAAFGAELRGRTWADMASEMVQLIEAA